MPLRHRLSVARLTAPQVAHVRRAFAAAQAISDDRGFGHWAGIHGLPLPMYGPTRPDMLRLASLRLLTYEDPAAAVPG